MFWGCCACLQCLQWVSCTCKAGERQNASTCLVEVLVLLVLLLQLGQVHASGNSPAAVEAGG